MENDYLFDFDCLRKRDQRDEDEDMELVIRNMCQKHSKENGQLRNKKMKSQKQSEITMWEVLQQPITEKKASQPRISKSKSVLVAGKAGQVSSASVSGGSTDGSKDNSNPCTLTTSHSFKNRGFSQKWKERDTRLFFKALSLFGTDFSMVALLFRGRDRSQLINKYHKEERDNPKRVESSLRVHRQGSSHVLKRCSRILESNTNGGEQIEIKGRVRGGSASSLDSLDQMIFDELDVQISKGKEDPSCGSLAQP